MLFNDYDEDVYFFEQIFVPQEIAPQIVAELFVIEGITVTTVVAQRVGFNDIHLFNAVKRKVAKRNAVDELKDISDEVIGPVAQDGFAEFIEKLIGD